MFNLNRDPAVNRKTLNELKVILKNRLTEYVALNKVLGELAVEALDELSDIVYNAGLDIEYDAYVTDDEINGTLAYRFGIPMSTFDEMELK